MEILKQAKVRFNALPGAVKVLIYSGVSTSLGVVLLSLQDGTPLNTREVLVPIVSVVINVLAYLVAREDA